MTQNSFVTSSLRFVVGCVLAILSLVDREGVAEQPAAELIRSARSGPWSAPGTWQREQVPAAGARVQIRTGHSVLYDVHSDRPIRSVHVAGTLTFARDRDTRLDVGLIKIQAGDDASESGFDCDAHIRKTDTDEPRPALEVGTPEHPIAAGRTALIRLVYFAGMDKESCPAIVCCGGRMDLHGALLSRTWVKLGATATKGSTTVTLAEAVTGWRVGDRVVVTPSTSTHKASGTRRPDRRTHEVFTEVRVVKAMNGSELTLDRELAHEHSGAGDYRAEVANLSRNVVVESADPEGVRGHTMYHRGSAGSISYAEFGHLGKEGVLGRYSLHFHLCGDTMRGSSVIGASIWDSHNRWLTIHGTNFLVVRDCVGYQSVGHGFFLEDGTEVDNVLDRNLAVQAFTGKKLPKQVFMDDPNDGAGFWWANSRNTFTRNVSCENDRYGFRYDASPIVHRAESVTFEIRQPDGTRKPVDVRTLPFIRFEDNEAHCDGAYGLNLGNGVERVGPDHRHPFVVRNMKIWEVHLAFVPAAPSVLVENMRIFSTVYGVYLPNYDHHVYRNLHMTDVLGEPFNRGHDDRSIQYGPLTVEELTFAGACGNPLIQISDDNPTGMAVSHFRDVKVVDRPPARSQYVLVNLGVGPRPGPKTPKSVPIYLHDYFAPGEHAKVVSTRAPDLIGDGSEYREEPPLTGDESRVAQVRDVPFPQLLDPVDDLPPATVITHVRRMDAGKVLVRGTTSDGSAVKRVLVNGKEASPIGQDLTEWQIVLHDAAGAQKLAAHSEDSAGNIEPRPHVVILP